jgi:Ran GTPase-activating protein (RanGAP) involved in mRNA processing and transport
VSLAAAASIGQLQQLDLSHNELGPAAGAGLAGLLQKATSLQVLKLNSTQLQDEGGWTFGVFVWHGICSTFTLVLVI